jgi:hypothetical protein
VATDCALRASDDTRRSTIVAKLSTPSFTPPATTEAGELCLKIGLSTKSSFTGFASGSRMATGNDRFRRKTGKTPQPTAMVFGRAVKSPAVI